MAGLEKPTPIGLFVGPMPRPALAGKVLGTALGATVDRAGEYAFGPPIPGVPMIGPNEVKPPTAAGFVRPGVVPSGEIGAGMPPPWSGIGALTAACCSGCGLPFSS